MSFSLSISETAGPGIPSIRRGRPGGDIGSCTAKSVDGKSDLHPVQDRRPGSACPARPGWAAAWAGSKLHLLPGGQVLDGGEVPPDLVLSQDDGVGDAELVRIGELLLELLPLRLDLGADACLAQLGGQGDGRGQSLVMGSDKGVGGRCSGVEIALVPPERRTGGSKPMENAHPGSCLFGVIFRCCRQRLPEQMEPISGWSSMVVS